MDEDYTKLDMERVSLNFKIFAKTLLSDPYQKLKIDSEAKKKLCRVQDVSTIYKVEELLI